MAVKISDTVAKVQAAVDAINKTARKFVLSDPMVDRNYQTTIVIYLYNFENYIIRIENQEVIDLNDSGKLIGLIKELLIDKLWVVSNDVRREISLIQGL